MKKTVFILGAGASYSYGFPVGSELANLIAGIDVPRFENHLRSEPGRLEPTPPSAPVQQFFKDHLEGSLAWSHFPDFQRRLRHSNCLSIDLWTKHNPDYEAYSKAAIATLILQCEAYGKKTGLLRGGWYTAFWNRIIREDVDESDVAFVTFNYDRSLEFFLQRSAIATFGSTKGADFLGRITIDHVYGQVGEFAGERVVGYGEVEDWPAAAQQIKLMRSGPADISRISQKINDADTLVFMGFGFDSDNLDTLGFERGVKQDHKVVASCHGLGPPVLAKAQERFGRQIVWGDFTCEEFFAREVYL